MTTPVILRVQQQGYVRPEGYQATQWALTVPLEVPPGDPALGTTPESYLPLFLVDTAGSLETLLRVTTLKDLVDYPEANLTYFEPRWGSGYVVLRDAVAGDILRITPPPGYWLQTQEPYDDTDFEIEAVEIRTSGDNPVVALGNSLQLPGYTPSNEDIGRWVYVSGFVNNDYNGWTQIRGVQGNVLLTNKAYLGSATGTGWYFYWIKIKTDVGPTLEPRYFPTRERNLSWAHYDDDPSMVSPHTTGRGGATARNATSRYVRTRRYTHVAPSLAAGLGVFATTRAQLEVLQASANTNGSDYSTLITVTVGP